MPCISISWHLLEVPYWIRQFAGICTGGQKHRVEIDINIKRNVYRARKVARKAHRGFVESFIDELVDTIVHEYAHAFGPVNLEWETGERMAKTFAKYGRWARAT